MLKNAIVLNLFVIVDQTSRLLDVIQSDSLIFIQLLLQKITFFYQKQLGPLLELVIQRPFLLKGQVNHFIYLILIDAVYHFICLILVKSIHYFLLHYIIYQGQQFTFHCQLDHLPIRVIIIPNLQKLLVFIILYFQEQLDFAI